MRNLRAYPITYAEKLRTLDGLIEQAAQTPAVGGVQLAALQSIKTDIEKLDVQDRTGGTVRRTEG